MFRLLFLPLRIARRFLWLIIWYSVYFLIRRPKLFILAAIALLVGILYSGWEVYQNTDMLNMRANTVSIGTAKATTNPKDIPAVTGKIEDGNSAFATNILTSMQLAEQQVYSREFYQTMLSGTADQEHRWMANPSVYGSITPQELFKSGNGATCRRFSEVFSVRKINQKFSGISCQKSDGGWCKLRPTSVPICDMKQPGSLDMWWHNKSIQMRNWF